MKPYQNILTTLVILQVATVILLGLMAFFGYQSQAEVQQLRTDLQEARVEEAQRPINERLAALEARAGMRDPDADRAAAALQTQMAESNVLQERFQALQGGAAQLPPPPVVSNRPPAPTPQPTVDPALAGLSPVQQAVAQLPIVAEILTFDEDWQFFTINKGQLDGIQANQELAVRNKDGYELLANVKVSRLHPQDAIVEVIRGTEKQGGPTPAPGDVLIDTSKLK